VHFFLTNRAKMLSSIRSNFIKLLPQNCIPVRKYAINPIPEAPKKKDEEDDEDAEDFKKFKMKQQHFQKEDGLPVHLKGGKFDKFLYYTTLTLAGFGLVNYFGFIYYSALSEKNKKKFDEFSIK
jgi:hypothetical protein